LPAHAELRRDAHAPTLADILVQAARARGEPLPSAAGESYRRRPDRARPRAQLGLPWQCPERHGRGPLGWARIRQDLGGREDGSHFFGTPTLMALCRTIEGEDAVEVFF